MNRIAKLSPEERSALWQVFFHPDITRLKLMELLQTSHLTVSNTIKTLEKAGLLCRSGKMQGESGRPSTTYRIDKKAGTALGVHLDADSIRFVLIDAFSDLLMEWSTEFSLPAQDGWEQEDYIDLLESSIRNGLARIQETSYGKPASIGISLPGMVDSEKGIWISGLQLQGIRNIPLGRELQRRLGIPVSIEDSARSLIVLEKIRGAARGYSDIILLYLGRGMGTGIVVHDRIVRGFRGTAGEIGHIPHGASKYRCSCGNIGCFETVVSASGIVRIFSDRLAEGVSSRLQRHRNANGEGYSLNLEDILEAAHEGDHLSIRTLAEIGVYIGDACDILIKLFNPQILLITGVGSIFSDYLKNSVESTIGIKIAPEISKDFSVVFPGYQQNYEAWGAAMVSISESLEAAH